MHSYTAQFCVNLGWYRHVPMYYVDRNICHETYYRLKLASAKGCKATTPTKVHTGSSTQRRNTWYKNKKHNDIRSFMVAASLYKERVKRLTGVVSDVGLAVVYLLRRLIFTVGDIRDTAKCIHAHSNARDSIHFFLLQRDELGIR